MNQIPGYFKFAAIAMGATLLIVGMTAGSMLLVPLAWAILLTLMALPLANWLERWLKYRTIASIVTVLILVVVVGGILILLAGQAIGLADDTPLIAQKLGATILAVRHYADAHFNLPFAEQPDAFQAQFSATFQGIMQQISSTLQQTLTTMALLVVIPIYVFFLLNYRVLFLQFVLQVTRAKEQDHMLHTVSKASKIVQGYLRGAAIEVVIMGIMVSIVFLALGIKHALFFAIFVALLNIIPYVGVFIGSVVSVAYAFFTTDSLIYPALVFILLWVIQIIDNNFVVPFVVGQQIKLNPLAILLVVVLGGMIWGVSGMIIFIPALGMLKVILDESKHLQPYGALLGEKPSTLPADTAT